MLPGVFTAELTALLATTLAAVNAARAVGDEFLAEALSVRADDLRRIAADHGLELQSRPAAA